MTADLQTTEDCSLKENGCYGGWIKTAKPPLEGGGSSALGPRPQLPISWMAGRLITSRVNLILHFHHVTRLQKKEH